MLSNPYYLGIVVFDGVEYEGRHPAIIDRATFDRIQAQRASRAEARLKFHKHPHYLKGSLVCDMCGRWMGVSTPRGNGGIYSYFYCPTRAKRNACPQGHVSQALLERLVEDYWVKVTLPAARISEIWQAVRAQVLQARSSGAVELASCRKFAPAARNYAAARLAADVGLRINEARMLDLDDVRWELGRFGKLNVRHGKGSRRRGPKPRLVPLINGADRGLCWFIQDVWGLFGADQYGPESRCSPPSASAWMAPVQGRPPMCSASRWPRPPPATCQPGRAGSPRMCCGIHFCASQLYLAGTRGVQDGPQQLIVRPPDVCRHRAAADHGVHAQVHRIPLLDMAAIRRFVRGAGSWRADGTGQGGPGQVRA
jgi:Recombinase zinc beta ribbon domain/Recombinase